MTLNLRCGMLAVLACLTPLVHAADGTAAKPTRATISLQPDGREVAGIVRLPTPVARSAEWTAVKQEERPAGSMHMSGNVKLYLVLENAAPVTLFGDDMTVRIGQLDAAEARALDDLKAMGKSDQAVRANLATISKADEARMHEVDHANMQRLSEIVGGYGWPTTRFAGAYASSAFMVVQHADIADQHTYLPMLRAAAAKGDLPASELAMLEDHVLMREGKPQLYCTQFESLKPLKQYAVADPAHLEEHRRAVGLPSMDVYVKSLHAMYKID